MKTAHLFLDLDECSCYRADFGDVQTVMQMSGCTFDVMVNVSQLLLNPQLKNVYGMLKGQFDEVVVILYTRRPTTIKRELKMLPWPVKCYWNGSHVSIDPMFESGKEFLDKHIDMDGWKSDDVKIRYRAFEKLFLCREAIKKELGLHVNPYVVVCSASKDVESTLSHLKLTSDFPILFDDNDELDGQPHVVVVPQFVSLSVEQHKLALDALNKAVPEITDEMVKFTSSGKFPRLIADGKFQLVVSDEQQVDWLSLSM
jgi:hypothetical protein